MERLGQADCNGTSAGQPGLPAGLPGQLVCSKFHMVCFESYNRLSVTEKGTMQLHKIQRYRWKGMIKGNKILWLLGGLILLVAQIMRDCAKIHQIIALLTEILVSEAQICIRSANACHPTYFEGAESESAIGTALRGFAGAPGDPECSNLH